MVDRGFVLERQPMNERTTESNGSATKGHFFVTRKDLEHFLTLSDELEGKIKAIDTQKLTHWEKFAVEQTLQRLDEQRREVDEVRW